MGRTGGGGVTGRPPKTVHLWHRPTRNTSWCGRIIDPMFLADDVDDVTCRLCMASYAKAGRLVQQVLL